MMALQLMPTCASVPLYVRSIVRDTIASRRRAARVQTAPVPVGAWPSASATSGNQQLTAALPGDLLLTAGHVHGLKSVDMSRGLKSSYMRTKS
jgi:hypothetical protein